MITLDPVTITVPPSAPQTVEIANNALYRPGKVRLANESPYLLKVQVGGDTHWLSAWTADVFACNGQSNLTVSAQLIGQSQNAPSSTLLVALAGEGEDFPGTYPIGLDRMTSIATGTVQLTASSVTINGNVPVTNPAGQQLSVQTPRKFLSSFAVPAFQLNGSVVVTVDAGAQHIVVLAPIAPNGTQLSITGQTSNVDYLTAINGGSSYVAASKGGALRIAVPIDPEIDTQYSVALTYPAGGIASVTTIRVSESFVADAVDVIDGIPLSVDVTDRAARALGQVTVSNGSQQSPNNYADISANIAAGAALGVVAVGGNGGNWLHAFALWCDDAGGFYGYLRANQGGVFTPIMHMRTGAAGVVCGPLDFKGLQPVAGSAAFELVNNDSVAHTVRGLLTYYR